MVAGDGSNLACEDVSADLSCFTPIQRSLVKSRKSFDNTMLIAKQYSLVISKVCKMKPVANQYIRVNISNAGPIDICQTPFKTHHVSSQMQREDIQQISGPMVVVSGWKGRSVVGDVKTQLKKCQENISVPQKALPRPRFFASYMFAAALCFHMIT